MRRMEARRWESRRVFHTDLMAVLSQLGDSAPKLTRAVGWPTALVTSRWRLGLDEPIDARQRLDIVEHPRDGVQLGRMNSTSVEGMRDRRLRHPGATRPRPARDLGRREPAE